MFLERFFLNEQRSCDRRVGAQRPVGRGNEIKMTGARSARARTRGQNPLVEKIRPGAGNQLGQYRAAV